ncbi:MAG: large subunit ribosomal protein L18 [Pseudoalteromonas tetraodonis]|jgi:large subunit ribosomal protein L18
MPALNRKEVRRRVHSRIRKKISGTAERPRLAVHFSNKNIYAQLIDDEAGRTLASASTKDKAAGLPSKVSSEVAAKVGALIAERCKAVNVSTVVFDRGGYIFHGKVKALAEAAREGGLQF